MVYDRFAAVDENELFPPSVREALAASPELRSLIIPMTQVQRNNLTGDDLWDGRVIANTTSDRLNRYDAGSSSWKVLIETDDLSVLTTADAALDTRLDAAEAALVSLDARQDADETYTRARVTATVAGLQLDGASGRWFFDVGFTFRVYNPVVSIAREISGTREVDSKTPTGFLVNGIIFVTGGTLSAGLSHNITVID